LSKKESKRTPSPQVFFRQGGKPAQKLRHPDASLGMVPIEAFFAYTSEKASHKLSFLLIFIKYLYIMNTSSAGPALAGYNAIPSMCSRIT
jgi:hypothetical protein